VESFLFLEFSKWEQYEGGGDTLGAIRLSLHRYKKTKKRKEKASISIYCHFLVPLSFVRVAMKFDTNLVVAKPWSKLFLGVGVGQAAASDALRLRRPEEVMHHFFTFCLLLLLGLERTLKCERVKRE
jgi:hypothetical protein